MGKKLKELSLDELEKLTKKVSKLIKEKKKLLEGKDYLASWSAMLNDYLINKDVDEDTRKNLEVFIEKNFKPEEFKIITGEFIGKKSIHFGCETTKYLRDNYSLYYVTSEWGDWIKTTNKDIKGDIESMKNAVKPLSTEDIVKEFKTLDYSDDKIITCFKNQLLDYLHCLLFDECNQAMRDEENSVFVKKDHYFKEMAY